MTPKREPVAYVAGAAAVVGYALTTYFPDAELPPQVPVIATAALALIARWLVVPAGKHADAVFNVGQLMSTLREAQTAVDEHKRSVESERTARSTADELLRIAESERQKAEAERDLAQAEGLAAKREIESMMAANRRPAEAGIPGQTPRGRL